MNNEFYEDLKRSAMRLAANAVDDYQQAIHEKLLERADRLQKALDNEIGKQMFSHATGYRLEWYLRYRGLIHGKIMLLHDISWMMYFEFKKQFAE